jgi:hypothetical protein
LDSGNKKSIKFDLKIFLNFKGIRSGRNQRAGHEPGARAHILPQFYGRRGQMEAGSPRHKERPVSPGLAVGGVCQTGHVRDLRFARHGGTAEHVGQQRADQQRPAAVEGPEISGEQFLAHLLICKTIHTQTFTTAG